MSTVKKQKTDAQGRRLAASSAYRTLNGNLEAVLATIARAVLDDYLKHTGDKDPGSEVMDALIRQTESIIGDEMWKHVSDVTGCCRENGPCTDPEKHNLYADRGQGWPAKAKAKAKAKGQSEGRRSIKNQAPQNPLWGLSTSRTLGGMGTLRSPRWQRWSAWCRPVESACATASPAPHPSRQPQWFFRN